MAIGTVFILLASSLSLAFSASADRWSRADQTNTGITWGTCTDFGATSPDPNLSCGYYEVPMDYFDSAAGKARLAVVKYQATAPEKKGTLFVNPGGPGISGIEFLSSLGASLSTYFQGQHDLIAWDPRGVGSYTFPGDVICFDTYAEQFAFWDNTVVRSINETISTDFRDPKELDEFYSRVAETDAKLEEFGQRCLASKTGPYLKYIGTTSTIRDLVSLADEIVGPGQLINYYGYSYGTVIGAHFLTMFPDRVDHVVLDGIVHPLKWGSYDLDYVAYADIEKVFDTFTGACAQASAARCLLAGMIQGNATGSDVRLLITSTIDLALKLQRAGYTGLPAQSGEIKSSLSDAIEFPFDWPSVANEQLYPTVVAILTAGRAYGFTDPYILPENPVEPPPVNSSSPPPSSYPLEAIAGADGVQSNGVPLKNVFDDLVATTRDRTPIFGAVWSGVSTIPKWPVRSVEPLPTFERKTLSNRILVIGNTLDPITPFANAEYITQLLGDENAVLMELQAVGHTTFAQYSTCARDIVRNYLLNSELPQGFTKCAADSDDYFVTNATNARRDRLWRK